MTSLARRAAALAFAVLACVLPLGGAQAASGDDNFATAINRTDSTFVSDFAWDNTRTRSDADVLHINRAEAGTDCTMSCESNAIGFQVVQITGNPEKAEPRNVAHALNTGCNGCESAAVAYQIVLISGNSPAQVPVNVAESENIACTDCKAAAVATQFYRTYEDPVRITGTGRSILASVREDLEALAARRDLAPEQIAAQARAQEPLIREVLNNEVVLRSNPKQEPDALERRLFRTRDLD